MEGWRKKERDRMNEEGALNERRSGQTKTIDDGGQAVSVKNYVQMDERQYTPD